MKRQIWGQQSKFPFKISQSFGSVHPPILRVLHASTEEKLVALKKTEILEL